MTRDSLPSLRYYLSALVKWSNPARPGRNGTKNTCFDNFENFETFYHYRVSLRIQSECGRMWTRITPNTDTFQAVTAIIWKNYSKCF